MQDNLGIVCVKGDPFFITPNELPRSSADEVSLGSQFFDAMQSFGELTPKRLEERLIDEVKLSH